jgi:hypothetical protein
MKSTRPTFVKRHYSGFAAGLIALVTAGASPPACNALQNLQLPNVSMVFHEEDRERPYPRISGEDFEANSDWRGRVRKEQPLWLVSEAEVHQRDKAPVRITLQRGGSLVHHSELSRGRAQLDEILGADLSGFKKVQRVVLHARLGVVVRANGEEQCRFPEGELVVTRSHDDNNDDDDDDDEDRRTVAPKIDSLDLERCTSKP